MPNHLQPSEITYTRDRVAQILNEARYIPPNPNSNDTSLPIELYVEHSKINTRFQLGDIKKVQLEAASKRYREYCDIISKATPANHLEQLDTAYSKLLECHFQPRDIDATIDGACHKLARLPEVPPSLGNRWTQESISKLDDEYFVNQAHKTWDNLKVVRYVDKNIIRIALRIEIADAQWSGIFAFYINTISSLLSAALELSSVRRPYVLVLQAFLWTSWQRALMLHFSDGLNHQIKLGYDHEQNEFLAVDIVPAIQRELRVGSNRPDVPGYMCKWAFKLLNSDRAAVGLDFRAFIERYEETLGILPPRCIVSTGGDRLQCEGTSPESCTRFKGMKIEDQSAHSSSCSGSGGCKRLFWNEQSYRGQTGARAVTIEDGDHEQLDYRTASSSTMTVSHVWSHGQGGRPENHGTGMNSCLHERYIEIARQFGCDSYWMDTPCIPQDHQLRREAIQHMNSVFATSKLTLVCDRDLMLIDVSNPSTELYESLLSVLLVCD
ncbi:uncharacterized protein F4822DRAFT_280754 [Hypoxylon trugodes]|uniref:uncharacterized protein n=1 Tax=Hypoxylon trugodes TaxID=326681 RepID=UPI00219C7655|nr:uncharacterized protein F4822DRAFT_280754 [Hypoxylon trugodes]KAI1387390.1 hypothetical protein F4822DRAFT_280754 [Hypoxylon trugodes]